MYVVDARAGEMQTASITAAKAIKITLLHFFRMLLLTFIIPYTAVSSEVSMSAAAAVQTDATSVCVRE